MKHLLALPYYKEVWKDIKDYEGLYQVSNLGRVRSLEHYAKHSRGGNMLIKGKILIYTKRKEYLGVILCKNGKTKAYSVHRLVAEAFIRNPHNYPTVDHINRVKTDNREENLRWAPYKLQAENRKERVQKNRKDESKPVEQYTLSMEFVAEYPSIKEAERQTGISYSQISKCCQNKPKYNTAGGYKWEYKKATSD